MEVQGLWCDVMHSANAKVMTYLCCLEISDTDQQEGSLHQASPACPRHEVSTRHCSSRDILDIHTLQMRQASRGLNP